MDRNGLTVGFHPPEECARGLSDCQSLAQVISSEGELTFMCCGEVLNGATPRPQDTLSFCMKGCGDVGNDTRTFIDRRDASHILGVVGMALATVMPLDDLHGVDLTTEGEQ